MKTWPIKTFEIETKILIDGLVKGLSSKIASKNPFLLFSSEYEFKGEVNKEGFKITRIVSYITPSRPLIYGEFQSTPNGTEIEIKMTLRPWFYPILILFILGAGVSVASRFDSNTFDWKNFVIPFSIPAVIFIYTLLSFWVEVIAHKKLLLNLINDIEKSESHAGDGVPPLPDA